MNKPKWTVTIGTSNCGCDGAYGDIDNGSASVATVWADTDELKAAAPANARLIAAAPDLLEVARLGFDLSAYTAAINFNGSPNTPEFLEELGERIEAFQNAANAAIQSATGSEA